MHYGLDVHKDTIQVCKLLFELGDSHEQSEFPNTEEQLKSFAKGLTKDDHVVFECTFNAWRTLFFFRHYSKAKVKVANSHKVKLIAQSRIKSDKIDAFTLAKLSRADFIPEVHLPEDYIWQIRQLSHHRKFLVKQRTAIKNSIWSILHKNLIKCPYSSPFTKKGIKWLRELQLSDIEVLMMDNNLNLLETLESNLNEIAEKMIEIGRKDKAVQLLISLPGIDLASACGVMAAIDDIEKFETPEKLASYFGLVPRLSQSGQTKHLGRITKEGSAHARWLLTEAAQAMALTSCPLAGTFFRVKARKGHNKAIVALARKMTTVIWHMLNKGEPYRYAPPARTREKLRKLNPKAPVMDRAMVARKSIEEVYKEFSMPLPTAASPAEKRAATNNRRSITNVKKKLNKTNQRITSIKAMT